MAANLLKNTISVTKELFGPILILFYLVILFVRIPIFNQSEAWVHILDIRHGPFVVSTIRSFPHSWLIISFVTRVTHRCHMWSRNRVHLWSTRVHPCGVCVARSLVFCLMSCKSLFALFSFLLANVLFVLLRFTSSDYPYGIFKLFSLDTILEQYHQRIIISKFGQIGPVVLQKQRCRSHPQLSKECGWGVQNYVCPPPPFFTII
jgi:hypothetical protein